MLPQFMRRRTLFSAALLASASVGLTAIADEPTTLEATFVEDIATFGQEEVVRGVRYTQDDEAVDAAQEIGEPIVDSSSDTVPAPVPAPMAAVSAPCNCCVGACCCTKKKKEAATAAMKGAYKGVFYANNFSYLNDPCYDGPSFIGDNLKGLMDGKLDLGGEIRVRYHNENNHRGLGVTGVDDDFWLTRYRMFANWRVNDIFRIYGEYLYADSAGEAFNSRPIEENRGEMQNLFLDTKLTDSFNLRVGRQEILLGAQRLISPLDWANTRRTFDGYRGTYTGDTWTVDGFFLNPVNRNAANQSKIDDTNENFAFWGVYGATAATAFGSFEPYYLGVANKTLNYDYHTLGSRVVGETGAGWLYELEGGAQFGGNTDGSGHGAGFVTGGVGRKLSICTPCGEWNPIIWGWYDWASGEGDPNSVGRGDNGFDHLFPLAHKYNGFMDLFGRRNLNDVNFQFITPIFGPKVKLLLWYHHFFMDELTTPYGVTMAPYNNPAINPAGSKELGQEIDVLFNIALNPRNSALVGYSHFNSGDYFQTTTLPAASTTEDADFFYFQYQMRF